MTADREAEITVRDEGPEVPLDVLADLFNPFFTTKEGGLTVSSRLPTQS